MGEGEREGGQRGRKGRGKEGGRREGGRGREGRILSISTPCQCCTHANVERYVSTL